MRWCVRFILSGLVLLGGCRAREAAPNPASDQQTTDPVEALAPAPRVAKADDGRPLLVCFGDSLTAGYGAEAGQSYPDFLQADLDRAGFKYRVVNEGVSGATSKDGVLRLAGVVAMKPAVVIVEFGGNDGLRGLPVAAMRSNLDHIVAALQSSGSKVMVAGITLPPDYGPDYVNNFTASYPLIGKKYNVPVMPFLLKDVFGVPGMMQADRTHATARGNEVVARNVLPVVEGLLKK